MLDLERFPGGEIVAKGLRDLDGGSTTEEALLVSMAAPRLRGLGFNVPDLATAVPFHHALFSKIESRLARGAHAEYNALVSRIVSFANAYRA